jgi:hypothetical protein
MLLLAIIICPGNAVADSSFVILRTSDDGNRYFVVFAARGPIENVSGSGHAFVAFGTEDTKSRKSSFVAYGLYPKNRTTLWDKLMYQKTVAYGSVPAELVDEIEPYATDDKGGVHSSVPDMTDAFVVEVDKTIFDQAHSLALMTMGHPGNFKVMQRDCVTMMQSVALNVGIIVPPRILGTNALPQNYVKSLIAFASKPTTIATPAWTWNGFTYLGLPLGYGTYTFPNGDKFVGTVRTGWLNGHGTMTYHAGASYTGDFADGRPDGDGVLSSKSGVTYDCKWADGLPVNGNLTLPLGDKYSGTFKNGKPLNGTFTFAAGLFKGAIYTGDMQPNFRFGGKGTMLMPNGDKYVGGWADSRFQGWGTIYPHGNFPPFASQWNQGTPVGGPPPPGVVIPAGAIELPAIPIGTPAVTGSITPY